MTNQFTRDQSFFTVEKKVGIFIIIATIGIIVAIIVVGMQQNIFTPKTTLYFIADSGKDIKAGQNITLSGFKIGKVNKVLLDDVAKVKVEFSIYSDYMKWITVDAKARLVKELPIGEGTIEIIPGSKSSEKIKQNGSIEFEKVPWFSAMTDNLNPIPITVEESPYFANLFKDMKMDLKLEVDPLITDFRHALKNLRMLSEETLETKDQVNSMLKNTDKSLKSLEAILMELSDTLPAIFSRLDNSLDDVDRLLMEGINVAKDAKEITEALKHTWPISSHIKKLKSKEKKEEEEQKRKLQRKN